MVKSIYITSRIPKNGIAFLTKKGFSVKINDSGKNLSRSEIGEVFSKFDGIITLVTDRIDDKLMDLASSRFKIISNFGVGFDNIDVLAARRRGIVVTNTPGVASESVAEHTFALILALSKHLLEADKFIRTGKFGGWDPALFLSSQVWGKTIGIVGLGRIGTYVGHIAFGGFKMNVVYHDILRLEDFEMLTEARYVNLHQLLNLADIVTLHVPLTPQTRHMIGKKELAMMKNSAILINTSRGQVVDEDALAWALNEAKIAAAGLDVFENEPRIPEELIKSKKVILTPHIASATVETREAMAQVAAQNIIDFFEEKTPFGLVKVS